jgi:uncharacterized protein YodC (DUF2158 family)
MPQFQAGDVVQLKSGGPKMTVESTEAIGGGKTFVDCIWFEGTTKVERHTFPEEALQKS